MPIPMPVKAAPSASQSAPGPGSSPAGNGSPTSAAPSSAGSPRPIPPGAKPGVNGQESNPNQEASNAQAQAQIAADSSGVSSPRVSQGVDGRRVGTLEVLPGVFENFDPEQTPMEAETNPTPTPTRDSQGRFIKPGVEGTREQVSPPDPNLEPVTPPEDASQAPKINFAGRQYAAMADAEQAHRHLRTFSEQMTRERNDLIGIVKQWKDAFTSLSQRVQGGAQAAPSPASQGTPPSHAARPQMAPPSPAETSTADEGLAERIDWSAYDQINSQYGAKVATVWLTKKIADGVREEFRRELQTRVEPLHQERQQQQAVSADFNADLEALSQVAEIHDGNAYSYPELRDPKSADAVIKLWKMMGFKPEFARSFDGIHSAVLGFRDLVRSGRASEVLGFQAPQTPPAAANPNPNARQNLSSPNTQAADQAAREVAQAISASHSSRGQEVLVPDSSSPPVSASSGSVDELLERFRKGIRQAGGNAHPEFPGISA